jgi:hypothetical protein
MNGKIPDRAFKKRCVEQKNEILIASQFALSDTPNGCRRIVGPTIGAISDSARPPNKEMALFVSRLVPVLAVTAAGLSAGPAPAQEDLNRGKSPAQLFASDCADCHRSPRALGKRDNANALAGFLRVHYTASRESAAAIANYLVSLGPDPNAGPARPSTRTRSAPAREQSKSAPEPQPAAKPAEPAPPASAEPPPPIPPEPIPQAPAAAPATPPASEPAPAAAPANPE